MKKRTTRPLRMLLVAAIVGALLVGSALAVRYWDDIFVQSFRMTESDKELMDAAFQDVYASVTQDGVTCTVTQILGTKHGMVVALETKLSEDIELAADAIDIGTVLLEPVHMEKEDLMAELEEREQKYSIDGYSNINRWSVISFILSEHVRAERGSNCGSSVINTINSSYDPETRTLTTLKWFEFSDLIQGEDCTLVVDGVYPSDMEEEISPYDPDIEDLLSSPIVIHFSADYQAQFQMYDIFQNGINIGTLELSPVSAQLIIPREPDAKTYSSLEEAALAGEKDDWDFNGKYRCVYVDMADSSELELKLRSCDSNGFAFYLGKEIIDLSQVKEVRLGDYTLTPQSDG